MQDPEVLENSIENVSKAADVLRSGGVILYPTDTIYGFGGDATDSAIVSKIRAIKGRGEEKPFLVLVDGVSMLREYAHITPLAERVLSLKNELPITLVLDAIGEKLVSVQGAGGGVGFRIPSDMFCLELVRVLGKPVVSTSANVSGVAYSDKVAEDADLWKEKGVDLSMHRGSKTAMLEDVRPSTVIDVRDDHAVVLREGALKEEHLRELLG